MDPWQVAHIQSNLDDLVRNTTCSPLFLAVLQREILGQDDLSLLRAKEREGSIAQSKLLYEILLSRKNAYNVLVEALKESMQTGSLYILEQASEERKTVCLKLKNIRESTKWSELSDNVKSELTNRPVIFQGTSVQLKKCCGFNQLNSIDGKFLVELAKGSRSDNLPVLVNNQLPESVPYYIQRSMRSRKALNPDFFQKSCRDVFVIQGLKRRELTKLAEEYETDVSGNQIIRLTVRFILLEYEGDFEKICKITNKVVHWIKYQNESYEWVKSSGSVKNLQRYVHKMQASLEENQLLLVIKENKNRVFVISDSPGMGKTILVTNIAHKILQSIIVNDDDNDECVFIVRFIVMKEIAQAFGKSQVNIDSIISLIAEQSSEFEFGKAIITNSIKAGHCLLIFDGFDEVLSEQVQTALKILQVASSNPKARVIVTTRPHMLNELENALHVLGHTINPFEEHDQMNFLLGFWESQGIQQNDHVKQFAKSCLDALTSNMSDMERDIAGIPLQCKLLAETYQEHAERCSNVGHEAYLHSIPLVTSIFEMYERHMNMRLDKMSKNQSLLNQFLGFMGVSRSSEFDDIKKAHMYYALNLLFPECATHFQSLVSSTFISMTSHLCGLGILEAITYPKSEEVICSVRFVHRTFAEYLIAWFVTEVKAERGVATPTEFILAEIMETNPNHFFLNHPIAQPQTKIDCCQFKFPVISYFINGFTKKYCEKQNLESQQDLASQVSSVLNFGRDDEVVLQIFTASAFHDYTYVPVAAARRRLEWSPMSMSQDTIINSNHNVQKLSLIAAKYSGVELMKIFCAGSSNIISKTQLENQEGSSLTLTPLHIAVHRGHYNLVEYFLNKYKSEVSYLQYLIHYCVFNSLADNSSVINSKKEIIELLLEKRKEWLDEPVLGSKTTPLLQSKVNVELVEHLIKQGANVNICDEDGDSVLLKVTRDIPLTPESYHRVVLALSQRRFQYFNKEKDNNMTPIFYAVKAVELLEETLQILFAKGADVNGKEKLNLNSVLFFAIMGGRSADLICRLIRKGAEVEHLNSRCEGVLHICTEYGNYEALKYFLENHKTLDINLRDKFGRTPLSLTAVNNGAGLTKRPKIIESMQRLLMKKGADVNIKTAYNLTILEEAFQSGDNGLSLSIIQLMEENGLTIDSRLASEALKEALSNTKIEVDDDGDFQNVLDYLIKKQVAKGAESRQVPWNPWKFSQVRRSMKDLYNATNVTPELIEQAKEHNLLDENDAVEIEHEADSYKSERFYSIAQEKVPSSFERVCLCLLVCNQPKAFKLLRSNLKKAELFTNFVTAPNKAVEFIDGPSPIMILQTKNAELSISRIKDSLCHPLHKELTVISEHTLGPLFPPYKLSILKWRTLVLTQTLINKLETIARELQAKVLCLCGEVKVQDEKYYHQVDIANDRFCWEDISRKIPHYLWCVFNKRKLFFTEFLKNPEIMAQTFGAEVFRNFQAGSVCKIGQIKVGHERNSSRNTIYLSPKMFHYFLPDKFVFQNISKDKLEQVSKFGHKIGCFENGDIENLDYVILEESQTSRFEEICKQTTNNVHLIQYTDNGHFQLVRTWGFDVNITTFFETKQICDNFPECGCNCGRDTDNIIANVPFHISIKGQTETTFNCSVNVSDLTPQMRKTLIPQHFTMDFVELKKLLECFNQQYVFEHILVFTTPLMCYSNKLTYKSFLYYETKSIESFMFSDDASLRALEQHADLTEHMMLISDSLRLKLTPAFASKWAHACIYGNYFNLLKLLISCEAHGTPFQKEELVILAVLYCTGDLQVLKLVMEQFTKVTGKTLDDIKIYGITHCDNSRPGSITPISILHVAALNGNYLLMEYLLSFQNKTSKLNEPIMSNLLHFCVIDTQRDNPHEISQRKLIIELLVKSCPALRQDCLATLLAPKIHVDLIKHLISLVVDETATNISSPNILHLCAEYMSPQEYHELVAFLHEENKGEVLQVHEAKHHKNPFHVAVEHFEILDSTLEIFFRREANFNVVDGDGDTVLMKAVKSGRSARVLDSLIRIGGADTTKRNRLEQTVLHVAAEEGNLTPIRYFTDAQAQGCDFKINVNATDKNKRTPLHLALLYSKSRTFEIVQHLLQHGASANAIDEKNDSPLMIAVNSERSARTLHALILSGADIRTQNKNKFNRTLLHEAVLYNNLIAFRYLLALGGWDVNAKDDQNDTPLHIALKIPAKLYHHFVQLLIQYGADVNARGLDDRTPISIAEELNKKGHVDESTVEILKNAAGKV